MHHRSQASRSRRVFAGVALALAGCAEVAPEAPEPVGIDQDTVIAGSVAAAAESSCSTSAVAGLSSQIIAEVNCIAPNTYAKVPARPNLVAGSNVVLFMQPPARDALVSALDAKPSTTMTLNSMLRTPAQQFLLAAWGDAQECGVELAAEPGSSNHEGGRAIDIAQFSTWRTTLEARGYAWFGPDDDVHYDYAGPGGDTRSLGVLAFQRLWNRNRTDDPIAEDGDYGPSTASRLAASPAAGFLLGAACVPSGTAAIEVYWQRQPSGSYELRALAPSSISRVEYLVDGFPIGGATTSDGANFPDSYTFSQASTGRLFEVRGFDASNTLAGTGVGSIDVGPNPAFFIRQMGSALYEVGIEQAPSTVAAVELRVDGSPITDSVSGVFRTTRLAVRRKYTQLGQRTFALSTFNANGTLRGTITRTFELR